MLKALQQEFDVTSVVRRPWASWFNFARRVIRRLSRGAIDIYWWPMSTALAAFQTLSQIAAADCDAVFAVAITPICAKLVTRQPTIFVSDATQASMVNYNPRHSALAPWLKKAAYSLESFCIQNARLALFPSEWASRSAMRDHGGSPERVLQIPWGANLVADEVTLPESRSPVEWRMLFVGVNWAGKGGDIALEAVAEMRRRGHSVHLDVVGSRPVQEIQADGVTFHGFLDKNVPADYEQIKALFAAAHVFFLPTQFDALGIVFAEAASFAVPAVSYRTGGVPSMVLDGETGVLLDEGASPVAFAEAIIALLSDRRGYISMCYAALARSRDHLNWAAWAAEVRRAIEAELAPPAASNILKLVATN